MDKAEVLAICADAGGFLKPDQILEELQPRRIGAPFTAILHGFAGRASWRGIGFLGEGS